MTSWLGVAPSTEERYLSATFGVDELILDYLWKRIKQSHWGHLFDQVHLLWALHFLKCFDSVPTSAEYWKVSPKTWRKYTWGIIYLLHLLLSEEPGVIVHNF